MERLTWKAGFKRGLNEKEGEERWGFVNDVFSRERGLRGPRLSESRYLRQDPDDLSDQISIFHVNSLNQWFVVIKSALVTWFVVSYIHGFNLRRSKTRSEINDTRSNDSRVKKP